MIPYKNSATNKYDITIIDGYVGLEIRAKKYGYEKTLRTIDKHPDVTAIRDKYKMGPQDDPLRAKTPGTNVSNLMMRDPMQNLTKKGKMSKLDIDRLKLRIKQNLGLK